MLLSSPIASSGWFALDLPEAFEYGKIVMEGLDPPSTDQLGQRTRGIFVVESLTAWLTLPDNECACIPVVRSGRHRTSRLTSAPA